MRITFEGYETTIFNGGPAGEVVVDKLERMGWRVNRPKNDAAHINIPDNWIPRLTDDAAVHLRTCDGKSKIKLHFYGVTRDLSGPIPNLNDPKSLEPAHFHLYATFEGCKDVYRISRPSSQQQELSPVVS